MLSTKAKIGIARALSAAILTGRATLGLSPQLTARRDGIAWQLDLREGIDFAIFLGLYQRIPQRVAQQWIKADSVVLDIGANIGAHSLPLATRVGPQGKVICVEPTDYAFAKLKANAALNPHLSDRMVLLQAALTDKSVETKEVQPIEFYSRWPLSGEADRRHARHLGQLETAKAARFVSLDALFDELVASDRVREQLTFVKLDVDGHEIEVLRGARITLARHRPAIVLEIAPHVQDEVPQRFEEVIETMRAYGYRLEENSGRPLPLSAPALRRLIKDGGSIDAVALPN